VRRAFAKPSPCSKYRHLEQSVAIKDVSGGDDADRIQLLARVSACDHLAKTPDLEFIGDTYLCRQLRKFTGQSGQEALCCCGIVAGDDGVPSAVGRWHRLSSVASNAAMLSGSTTPIRMPNSGCQLRLRHVDLGTSHLPAQHPRPELTRDFFGLDGELEFDRFDAPASVRSSTRPKCGPIGRGP